MQLRLTIFIIIFSALGIHAQELDCKVRINYSQMSANTAGDREVFTELERTISDFLNSQKWTNDSYQPYEKIKCNLNINLLKSSGQYHYSGNAQFQVIRPVFGTTYETVLLNYVDRNFDVSFAPENRQMFFNEQAFTSNLTSILAFYSFTALALDYDSFSRFGGNPYIERLYNIVNLAGTSVGGSWSNNADIRDRYWLMENLRNQQFASFRDGFYTYHRQGLDKITTEPENTRKLILEYLENLKTLNALRPSAPLINQFFEAKSEEIVLVFSDATQKEKDHIFDLCVGIRPDKTDIFRKLK